MTDVDERSAAEHALAAAVDRDERALLGLCLARPDATLAASEFVRPGDFWRPQHEQTFDACLALVERGEPVDVQGVLRELVRGGLPGQNPGLWLADLLGESLPGDPAWYARRIAEAAALRRLHAAGLRTAQIAYSGMGAEEALETARAAVDAAAAPTRAQDVTVGDLLTDLLDEIENPPDPALQVTPPWSTADHLLNPLQPGQLIVVGARPSVGKSLAAVDWVRHVALKIGRPAVLASLEMGRLEVMRRILSAEAKVDLSKLTRDSLGLGEDEWARISQATARLADAPLHIDDSPEVGLAHCRVLVRRHRPALLAVDYLGLMTTGRAENREQAVGEIARGLKLMAKAEGLPVMLVVQLNRAVESRGDKKPHMSDLRESGQVEAHADTILLLHRPEVYDRDDRPGEVDVIVAKQRNGPTGTVTLGAQLHYSRFVDLTGWNR